jgi:transcription elongation factor GreA
MTQQDFDELQAEIERLETTERAEIAERIRTARESGDLKENSEYHDAKNDQSRLETTILQLRDRLLHAESHSGEDSGDIVGFGSRVSLLEKEGGRELRYTLVATVSADAASGKLSVDSPVARALIGARVGDVVSVSRELTITANG